MIGDHDDDIARRTGGDDGAPRGGGERRPYRARGARVDALRSIADAADAVGLRPLAAATIESDLPRHARAPGNRRTEHALLFELPERWP